jgi:hypothetical protein
VARSIRRAVRVSQSLGGVPAVGEVAGGAPDADEAVPPSEATSADEPSGAGGAAPESREP